MAAQITVISARITVIPRRSTEGSFSDTEQRRRSVAFALSGIAFPRRTGYHTFTMLGLKESRAFPPLSPDACAALVSRLAAVLTERDDVAYAWAHGSSIEGLPFRDVDVAVARRMNGGRHRDTASDVLARAVVPHDSFDWSSTLVDALSNAIGMPVDVQPLDDAPASFRASAFRGLLICATDEDRLADDLERTAIERCEFEVHRRRMTRWALGAA